MQNLSRREFLKKVGKGAVKSSLLLAGAGLLMSSAGCQIFPVEKKEYTASYEYNGNEVDLKMQLYTPLAKGKYPLIGFSHGYYSSPELYKGFLENLASNGYVVTAPYHSDYISAGAGRNILEIANNIGEYGINLENVLSQLVQIPGYENTELGQVRDILCQCLGGHIDNREVVDIFRQDFDYRLVELSESLDFALDNLELQKKIDKNKIALAGHSLGGYSALENLMQRREIKAGLMLSPISALSDIKSISVPTRWVTGTLDIQGIYETAKNSYDAIYGDSSFVSFKDVSHLSFCGNSIGNSFSNISDNQKHLTAKKFPLRQEDIVARQNHNQKAGAINACSVDFFNHWLKSTGSESDFLNRHENLISEYYSK